MAQYGFYYTASSRAWTEAPSRPTETISGIETPDDKTIIFHLTQPTGDFLYRLAMPAAAPMPEEVGKCFTKAGEYGRNVVSSGPYMIEGSDKVDITSCDTIKPVAGFDPTQVHEVRPQPRLRPGHGQPDVRSNYVDGVEIAIEHEPRRHLQQDRGRRARRLVSRARRPRRCCSSTRPTRT